MIVNIFPKLSETFILNQIKGLIQNGHQVDIYAASKDTANNLSIQDTVKEYNLMDHVYYFPDHSDHSALKIFKLIIATVTRGYKTPGAVLWLLTHGSSSLAKGRRFQGYMSTPFIGKKHYDIIHFQFGNLPLALLQLRYFPVIRGPWIVSFRGYDLTLYPHLLGEDMYKEMFKIVDTVLPVSENFKARLIELGCDEQKIHVHRSAIDLNLFHFREEPPMQNGIVEIFTHGRLFPKKGLEYAIRAVSRIIEEGRSIRYSIIGNGPLKESLLQLIRDLDREDQIELTDGVPHDQIIERLRTSHIFLCPSVKAEDGDEEGIPNTLKEAMAVGLPVVATFHSGIPELVEDGVSGFLVQERDDLALADKIRALVDSPETRIEMGRQGRRKIEEAYAIEKWNSELSRVYHESLES
jgi:colanic acid/amylovoran biosynthesis glycosyltransferase